MRKDKKQKLIAIVALTISVLGLTLGFAAFSNTLTISSSATVTPDASDFKMRVYGADTNNEDFADVSIESYTLRNKSVPYSMEVDEPLSMNDAVISEDGLTISNMSATFQNVGEGVVYHYAIKNEGKYDAYLDLSRYARLYDGVDSAAVTCTAREGTRQDLVDQTCENINYEMYFNDADGNFMDGQHYINMNNNGINYLEIPAGSYIFLTVTISYTNNNDVFADGDFDVEIEDITFDFSTVKPSE